MYKYLYILQHIKVVCPRAVPSPLIVRHVYDYMNVKKLTLCSIGARVENYRARRSYTRHNMQFINIYKCVYLIFMNT